MKFILFLGFYFATTVLGQDIILNYTPTVPAFVPRYFQLTPNDTFLINDGNVIYEFDQSGEIKTKLPMSDGFWVDNFSYYPETGGVLVCSKSLQENYWIVDHFDIRSSNGSKSSSVITPIFKDGGRGHYVPQFLPYDGSLFLNLWGGETKKALNPPLLRKAILETKENIEFSLVGDAFCPRRAESTRFTNDFKRKWVVKDLNDSSRFVVADELQNRVWVYTEDGGGKFSEVDFPDMTLSHRVQPTSFFDPALGDSEADFDRWYYSFSRLTGLYNYGEAYIAGYIRPNPNYDWSSRPAGDVSPFILVIQQLDPNFKEIGEPLQFEGGFLIGAADYGVAYIFRPEGPKITIITYKDFPG